MAMRLRLRRRRRARAKRLQLTLTRTWASLLRPMTSTARWKKRSEKPRPQSASCERQRPPDPVKRRGSKTLLRPNLKVRRPARARIHLRKLGLAPAHPLPISPPPPVRPLAPRRRSRAVCRPPATSWSVRWRSAWASRRVRRSARRSLLRVLPTRRQRVQRLSAVTVTEWRSHLGRLWPMRLPPLRHLLASRGSCVCPRASQWSQCVGRRAGGRRGWAGRPLLRRRSATMEAWARQATRTASCSACGAAWRTRRARTGLARRAHAWVAASHWTSRARMCLACGAACPRRASNSRRCHRCGGESRAK
mmetsp:Transcript_16671/g.53229  ORF Transcript_16671/g.53229 Transcript_16671/m.53229 type:complete len:306 (+) Transcript_16671:2-919(+)